MTSVHILHLQTLLSLQFYAFFLRYRAAVSPTPTCNHICHRLQRQSRQSKNPAPSGWSLIFSIHKFSMVPMPTLKKQGIRLDSRWSVRGDWTPKSPHWDGLLYGVVDNEKLRKRINRWKIPQVSLVPHPNDDWQVIL